MKDLWGLAADLTHLHKEVVFIGGIAVQAISSIHDLPLEVPSDVDLVATAAAAGILRDRQELTLNKSCRKGSVRLNGVEVDIYIEHQNRLRFDYSDLATHARRLAVGNAYDVKFASIPHLILFKIDAMRARASSTRVAKDRRDLAKLFVIGADRDEDEDVQLTANNATGADIAAMWRVLKSTAFTEITEFTCRNARATRTAATKLRIKAETFVERVKKVRGT